MPVIRSQDQAPSVTEDERNAIYEQLVKELAGEPTPSRPVIFEIPLSQQTRIDVLVVWQDWKPFDSVDRSKLILKAYGDKAARIAQALGMTYDEAMEQQVLPYAVLPMIRPGDIDEEEAKSAMLAEGGFALGNGKVDLRFPTMTLAEQAHRRLVNRLPNGYWSIVQSLDRIQ